MWRWAAEGDPDSSEDDCVRAKRDVGAKRHVERSDYYTFTYLRVICPNLDLANH